MPSCLSARCVENFRVDAGQGFYDGRGTSAWLLRPSVKAEIRSRQHWGHLQTSRVCPAKSALPLRADIEAVSQLVGYGPETVADTSVIVELSDMTLGI
jgi:hypothetical protein